MSSLTGALNGIRCYNNRRGTPKDLATSSVEFKGGASKAVAFALGHRTGTFESGNTDKYVFTAAGSVSKHRALSSLASSDTASGSSIPVQPIETLLAVPYGLYDRDSPVTPQLLDRRFLHLQDRAYANVRKYIMATKRSLAISTAQIAARKQVDEAIRYYLEDLPMPLAF